MSVCAKTQDSAPDGEIMQRALAALTMCLILLLSSAIGSISNSTDAVVSSLPEEMDPKPSGARAYDNLENFIDGSYRIIDSAANKDRRAWIKSELELDGFEVEEQSFSTDECSDCMNIIATLPGKKTDSWIVIGAHHDAICYSPPPLIGMTYPTCRSQGAYDDGTGVANLLELAKVMKAWGYVPEHTWKFAFWDYEEWQGSSSSEGGGKGSLHFVETVPDGVDVDTYINLDMFGLNWPLTPPNLPTCSEDHFTLYLFASPVDDWSYYTDRDLNVTDHMRTDAARLQSQLKEILHQHLDYPVEWVSVLDDTKGNSDHYNFIQGGYASVWVRGMHEYIHEEGDTCEQTIKHAQSDNLATLRTYAGGQDELQQGFQTALDALAMFGWWDMNVSHGLGPSTYNENSDAVGGWGAGWLWFLIIPLIAIPVVWLARSHEPVILLSAEVADAELLDAVEDFDAESSTG